VPTYRDSTQPVSGVQRPSEVLVDERPWGSFRQYSLNAVSTVKLIHVDAGQTLSLQRHRERDELWVIIDHGLLVEIDGESFEPAVGDEFFIPRGTTHRAAGGRCGGRFLEVAFGHFDEDDIERLEDCYGRA